MLYTRAAVVSLGRSRIIVRRGLNSDKTASASSGVNKTAETTQTFSAPANKATWWRNAELWGTMSALSGWTLSSAAIYDSLSQGPEVISLEMTSVLIVYSSLFFRWALVVKPQNLILAGCHFANVCAQGNQLRRAIEYKLANGNEKEVKELAEKTCLGVAVGAVAIGGGPILQRYLVQQNLGVVSQIAKSDAGPFRVHFWAPMSKWLISGASLLDYNRPTDKISTPQYAALSLCGLIHSRYALLVIPTNYMLFSVNIALLGSSGWHLGRKLQVKCNSDDNKAPINVDTQLKRRSTSWDADGLHRKD